MRHRKKINHLGRTASHRKAMLANMASSLILHKRIKTTTAKARELRTFVEPIITKSKDDTTHSRRVAFSYLQDKDAVSELFRDVSPKVLNRPGGYTRILKTGTRLGDNADMCIIELVDYNENLLAAKEERTGGAKRKRSRRGKAGGATSKKEQETSAETEIAPDKAGKQEQKADQATESQVTEESTPGAQAGEKPVDNLKEEGTEAKAGNREEEPAGSGVDEKDTDTSAEDQEKKE